MLGHMYFHGVINFNGPGIPKDYKKGKEWLEKAASQGNAQAQNTLGGMYYQGIGVKLNYTQAKALYEQAANKGNKKAQYNLGVI